MKEKIIEMFYMESYSDENKVFIVSEDFEEVADRIVNLVKEIIIEYGTDYSNLLK